MQDAPSGASSLELSLVTANFTLLSHLDRCGGYLASLLPRGAIPSSADHTLNFRGPSLRRGLKLGTTHLDRLTASLYGNSAVSPNALMHVWGKCEPHALNPEGNPRRVAGLIQGLFPNLPVDTTTREESITVNMVNLLIMMSGTLGKLKFGRDRCMLAFKAKRSRDSDHVVSIRLGFEDQRLHLVKGIDRKLPKRVVPDYVAAGMFRLAPSLQAMPRTSALYTHLEMGLPHLMDHLDALFGAAVYAGPEYELALTSKFNIVPVRGDDRSPNPERNYV